MARPTILVPLDGSVLAETGLLYLDALAPLATFEVEIIHVNEPLEAGEDEPAWDVAAYLQRKVDETKERTGLSVRYLNPRGIPYATILAESENPWISMILTTTHGLTGFHRWRMGSVADKVIRGAPCPTLVVGPSARGAPAAITRILVPLDGSKLAEEALPVAKALAEKLHAALQLVRAVIPRTVPDELAGTLTADVVESFELMANRYLEEARLELETSQQVDTAVIVGPAPDAILSQAEELPCDLITMTSHGRHGLVRFALGSVTERVLTASPAPVLVTRPAQWERVSQLFES